MSEYDVLSIIVPIWNAEKYLPACIESVISQDYKNIEIILVDDGSTDHSGLICDEWAARDNRIKVIHKENGGVVSAWMCGIENARGELLGFIDSDDYCDKDYYSSLMNAQRQENADIVFGGYSVEGADNNRISHIASSVFEAGVYEGERLEYIKENIFKVQGSLYWARWLRIVKRNLLVQNLHLFDRRVRVGDDIGMALATLFDSSKIVLTNTIGYHYVQNASSIMHSISLNEIDNFDLLCANIEKICTEKARLNYINREFTSQMMVVIKKILNSDLPRKSKKQLLKKLRASSYIAEIYKNKDYGKRSFPVKVCISLFKYKFFGLMSFF